MSNMVTRCPKCQTSFKVTDEHLKIANGAVRCGSCLHVFQARLHWVSPDSVPPQPAAGQAAPRSTFSQTDIPPPSEEKPAAPRAAASKFSFDQSAIDSSSASGLLPAQDDDMLDSALTRAHQPAAKPTGPARKLEEIGDDERISDDLSLEDDEPEIVPPTRTVASTGLGEPDDDYSSLFDLAGEQPADSDNFEDLFNGDFNDLDELAENAVDESGTGVSDDSWAQEMLEELRHEEEPKPVDLSQVKDVRDILADFTNPVDVDAARRDLGFDKAPPASLAREPAGSRAAPLPSQRAELIAHIEPPPVELAPSRPNHTGHDWKASLALHGTAAALLLLLAGQYIFFNFTQLARNETTRPWLEAVCVVARCTLPPAETWRYIKISNLVVRKHPQVADALAIDAIILNTSRDPLPFPRLEMYFSKDDTLPLASRRFEPAEYLSGEMAGQTMIPPGRPVHIALEIVHPGPEAVNWSMQVARQGQ